MGIFLFIKRYKAVDKPTVCRYYILGFLYPYYI